MKIPQKTNKNSKLMTLTTTVTNILSKRVTEEEAKQFALDNYGILATYIRQQAYAKLVKPDEVRKRRFVKVAQKEN